MNKEIRLKRYNARFFLTMSIEEMWDTLTGPFILVFDDGELQTDARETIYSGYAWEFHRMYPSTPLLLKHHIGHLLKGKRLGSNTHLELLGNAMWSVYDMYCTTQRREEDMKISRDDLAEIVYRLTNRMYNELSYRLEEYVVSLDIIDFVEVLEHPRVKEVNDNLEPTQTSIENAYSVVTDVLMNGQDLPNNPISLGTRSSLIKKDQVLQCVTARGYLTDTDSHLFRNPVLRGYANGIRLFHDSLVEAQSAAKSLIFSKAPLQQAEYFSRRLQLMSQIVRNLHMVDCGSKEYMSWTIRPPTRNEKGDITRDGDLKQSVGKYYMDTDGVLKVIGAGDKHLVGKTLQVRAVAHCAHPDPYGICAVCFGELSLSVPASTNIGHMCGTSMTQKASQNVMSVKHLDGSSAVDGIILDPDYRGYIKVARDESSYLLADELKGKSVKLVIPVERALNITDILEAKRIEDLNISRISELEVIALLVADSKSEERVPLVVNVGRRLASMTYPLLHYIREHKWDVDTLGNYVIDMKNWDWSQPILSLPLKHFNMSDHSRDVAHMLESTVSSAQERDKDISIDSFIGEWYDLVNDKLSVNLAVLEVIAYAAMIISAEKLDYSLPKPWTDKGLGVMKMTMMFRSLSAAMAFEQHHAIIVSPLSFTHTNRPDHLMDGIIMPNEVFTT